MIRAARDLFPFPSRDVSFDNGFYSKLLVDPDEFTQSTGLYACNPSIHFDGVTWRCNVRAINYKIGKVPEVGVTQNYMFTLDTWLDVTRSQIIADTSVRPRSSYPIKGYEDCRLFTWRGALWMSATVCDMLEFDPANNVGGSNFEMCLLQLDKGGHEIIRVLPMRGPWSQHPQKNWVPQTDREQLRFLYSIDRHTTMRIADVQAPGQPMIVHDGDIKDWTHLPDELRGSSQAVCVARGSVASSWLFVAHDRDYASCFVLADDLMRPQFKTEKFYFHKPGIEFCAGLALDGDRLVASYSVNDASVELGIFSWQQVQRKMEPI